MGHGGHANAGKVKHGNKASRALIHPPNVHGAKHFFQRTVRHYRPLPTNGSQMKHVLIISYTPFYEKH